MSEYVLHNGNIIRADEMILTPENRGFHYGDGVFESIRVINGSPCFLETHIQRLFSGIEALKIKIPEYFTKKYFLDNVTDLIKKNKLSAGGKVRINVYRESEGNYLPLKNSASFLIQTSSGLTNSYTLNEKGLSVGLYKEMFKSINMLSNYKSLNGLLYIMAKLKAKELSLDDLLLLNEKQQVIESTSSNIFLVSNNVLYTPSLESGCLGGTMRMNVINIALLRKMKVYEINLMPQNLLIADEIFLTNAINGIQWIGSYESKRYYNTIAKSFTKTLNEKVINDVSLDLNELE